MSPVRRPTESEKAPRPLVLRGRGFHVAAAIGVFAAALVAVLANVLAARHYRRWDWTSRGLYTLSPVTQQTLHALEEPVSIHVLLSNADPLTLSLRHLLEAYRAESQRLDVHFVDPDTDTAEFIALQNRYDLAASRSGAGRVVTDAAVIVARGERHHFIPENELIEIQDPEEGSARPHFEQALTSAIRDVLGKEKRVACFTQGHGELPLASGAGLAPLEDWLRKHNFETLAVPGIRDLREKDPLPDCRLVIVPGPDQPVPAPDAERIARYLGHGGSVLLAIEAVPDPRKMTLGSTGLEQVLAKGNLVHRLDFVIERDPLLARTDLGNAFAVNIQPHDITAGLLAATGIEVELTGATSFVPGTTGPEPVALLTTSSEAFGRVDFRNIHGETLDQRDIDHPGPLTVAWAVELPRPPDAAEGSPSPRLVVLGSRDALAGANWQSPDLRGTAALVQSAVQWLAFDTVVVDIPDKPPGVLALKMGPGVLGAVLRWALLFIPGGAALIGIGIALRRRASEGRRRRQARATTKPAATDRRPADVAAAPDGDAPRDSARENKSRRGRSRKR